MTAPVVTRRRFSQCLAATGALFAIARRAAAADFSVLQYHNQPVESPLHKRLTQMWDAIHAETGGRIAAQIVPANSDPDLLDRLVRGEPAFLTQAGNGLASLVPAANVQATPFAFRKMSQVYAAIDGDLGAYLRDELRARGLFLFPGGGFENGMHQITCATHPIRAAADLEGLRIRVPGTAIYLEFWKALGAVPVGMTIDKMHDALKAGTVQAQEDPLDVAELFHLYEVQKYMSITNHSWSGYNLVAGSKFLDTLPADMRRVIERNVVKYVRLQRRDTDSFNGELRRRLTARGMIFNNADTASFRARLGSFYPRWRDSIGNRAWSLLEGHVGKLG